MKTKKQSSLSLGKVTSEYEQPNKPQWTRDDLRQYKQEVTITKKVRKWLDSQKDIAYYKASDRYQKGVSDLILNVGGVFVLIELKAKSGKPTPHQRLFIKEMTLPGGLGAVCYCLADVKEIVHAARLIRKNY